MNSQDVLVGQQSRRSLEAAGFVEACLPLERHDESSRGGHQDKGSNYENGTQDAQRIGATADHDASST